MTELFLLFILTVLGLPSFQQVFAPLPWQQRLVPILIVIIVVVAWAVWLGDIHIAPGVLLK